MRDQRRRRRFSSDSKPAVETPPPHDVSTPEIPVLKEKEEEKKGGGAAWYSGSGSASELVGGEGVARVGGSMAMRGGFLGRIAAALSNALGGPGTFLGGLFASALGQWLVGAGLVAWAGLMLAAAGKVFGWGAAVPEVPAPSLAGLGPSGISIKNPNDRSLNFLAGANKGEILWDQGKGAPKVDAPKDAAAPETPPPPPEAKKEDPPPFQMPDVSQVMGQGLNRDGFVHKMTSDVGSLHAGGFGNAMPKLKDAGGFELKKSFAPNLPGAQRGKLGALQRAHRALNASRLSGMKGNASRAAGQLKLANSMSTLGATAGSDQNARTYAGDAFDQGKSIGGELAGVQGGDGIVVPPGDGAPGLNQSPPDLPPGVNQTPYQNQMDNAQGLGNQAAALKMLGMMLLALGAMLTALGISIAAIHSMEPIGWAIAAAGAAMIAMGMMMLGMSSNMANQAKNQGNGIKNQYGQQDQGNIVNDCASQAANNGTQTQNCQTTNPSQNVDSHQNVHQATQQESNATFTLTPTDGGGGGSSNGNVSQGQTDPALKH